MDFPLLAGIASTLLFALSNLPMLLKAARTRDLRSYSLGNLALINAANGIHSLYVFSLPAGPIWLLHGFYLVASVIMLALFLRFHRYGAFSIPQPPSEQEAERWTRNRSRHRPSRADIVVIGGGQAGLALGYHLVRAERNFVILDAGTRVGDGWRRRWDSLRLFTPAKFDGLPGLPFPGDRLAFPTKDEQADYLEAYAARFSIPVRTGIRVERVRRDGDGFLVEAGSRRWRASSVVLATGAEQVPFVPAFADRIAESILQLHSSEYRNPAQLRPGPVLVVGVGNSGAEIALELSADREVLLAGQPVGSCPPATDEMQPGSLCRWSGSPARGCSPWRRRSVGRPPRTSAVRR